jgi:hypothetical protein
MRKQIAVALCSAVLGCMSLSSHAVAQQKTAKACQAEWRANKASNQANGITEKAYVAQCRGGAAAVEPTAVPTAPASPPAATTPRVSRTATGQKTAKECQEEWRANKAANQASGVTERSYVDQCRAGNAPTQPTAAPAAPTPSPTPTAAAPRVRPTQTTIGQKTAKECREEWRANKAANQASGVTERAYVDQCRAGGTLAQPTAAPTPPPSAAPAPTAAPAAPAPTPTAAAPAPTPTAAAPAPAPTAAAPPPARPAAPPISTASPAPGAPGTPATPAGANEFSTEAEAKGRCPSDTVVWVALPSRVYHFSGTRYYGNTKHGAYMCEGDTAAAGMRGAKNETHP